MGITQNKTLLVIGVVLLLVVFAFSYKAYSVNLQKEKELVIIEAQRQKEESILRQKNEALRLKGQQRTRLYSHVFPTSPKRINNRPQTSSRHSNRCTAVMML